VRRHLRHVELGSFAVPREWTDWAPLEAQAAPTGQPLLGFTPAGFNWADRYPRIVEALRSLRVRSITIDGEAGVA
jgi:hypothetical protein